MNTVEQKISPLIQSMFPAFYAEEGPAFISFVQAYYEFLEQNFQLLTLDNNTNFNIGDTVTQGTTTGTIINFVNSDVLVLVNELSTFECMTMCSNLTAITSSSGGSAYIIHGGTTKRLGALFLARNLPSIRDIDTTMDIFLTNFKQKYLCNIEFDTTTNKKLLIKNSFDLYRSKGTSRSIDLFFRLMYGVNTTVYYPAQDLFKLSAGQWYKPQYLEISCVGDSSRRAVDLIGKIITGVTSGAQAFVEKYVKHRTNNGFAHVLYVSNVTGTFKRGELIKSDVLYIDSPSILGSLGELTNLNTKSSGFNIGDIVSVQSTGGINGLARVTGTNSTTGSVNFDLLDGGWGYSVNIGNSDPSFLRDHSQTIVSDNILSLSNVNIGNIVSGLTISTPGSSYKNTDIIAVVSSYTNALARPITDSTGSVKNIVLTNPGTGFFGGTPTVLVSNSTGGSSTGSSLTLSIQYDVPTKTFAYLQKVIQKKAFVTFDTATPSSVWTSNVNVQISNGSSIIGSGTIISINSVTPTTGTLNLLLSNNFMVSTNNTILVSSNTQITANIASYSDVSATGKLITIPTSGTLHASISNRYFNLLSGDTIYQKSQSGTVTASAKVFADVTTKGVIQVTDIQGSFTTGSNVYSVNSSLNTTLIGYDTSVGIYSTNNTFISTNIIPSAQVAIPYAGINAVIENLSTGVGAEYSVANVSNLDTIKLNTDIIANTTMYKLPLNSTIFNLPAQSSANLNSVIFNSLSHKDFVLGEISNLGFTQPGINYTENPDLLTYQPYTSAYTYRDYIFTLSNINGSFSSSEYIQQTLPTTQYVLNVSDSSRFIVGEKVRTSGGSNSTVISINSNVITVGNIQGTINTGDTLIKFANSSVNTSILNTTSNTINIIAKGLIKNIDTAAAKMYVKRIQFFNNFSNTAPIVGQSTGATANFTIDYDHSNPQIGWNANVQSNAFTANGIITSLSVSDSGFGFINGEQATFTLDNRSGTATVVNQGLGVGLGRYIDDKGFVSDLSKIHDGNYYQEYSYDIISRIPLEKYSDMFKKVMHTAGTKFFGSILVDSINELTTSIANSQLEYTNPYIILDRTSVDITDRSNIDIEIRS